MPVIDVRHPLVKHKVGLLREDPISTKKFRELTNELARLLAYEATADFPLEKTTIPCWSGPTEVEQIRGRKVTIVPILRAGLGMLDGVLDMIPSAKVSVVGLSRNHETLQPENYFEKFVGHLDERTAIIIDPMLATAGSMIATIDLLKQRGCKGPAPLCTETEKPSLTSFSTTSGTVATRFSPSAVSRGTPMRMLLSSIVVVVFGDGETNTSARAGS